MNAEEAPVVAELLRLARWRMPSMHYGATDLRVTARPDDGEPDERGGMQVAAVVAETPEEKVQERLAGRHAVVRRAKLEVYRTDSTGTWYVLRSSELVVGHPRGSQKVYASWRTVWWQRVRVLPDGRWLRTQRYGRGSASGYLSQHVYDAAGEEPLWGLLLPEPVYLTRFAPLADRLFEVPQGSRYRRMDSVGPAFLVSRFAGAEDVPTLTRQLFGARAYRKDLARSLGRLLAQGSTSAARQDSLDRVLMAWAVRGLVPVDWQVALLRGEGTRTQRTAWTPTAADIVGLRRHLRQLDQRSIRRLVLGGAEVSWTYLADIGKAPAVPGLTRVDDWRGLHDAVLPPGLPVGTVTAGVWAKAAAADFAVTRPTRLHRDLPGTTPAGRSVVVASTGAELREWGTSMRHCIATYQLKMWRKHSVLGAVLDTDGSMLGNFEIDTRGEPRLRQMLGRANTTLPAQVLADVEAHLAGHGVQVAGYLGQLADARHDLAA